MDVKFICTVFMVAVLAFNSFLVIKSYSAEMRHWLIIICKILLIVVSLIEFFISDKPVYWSLINMYWMLNLAEDFM